MNLRAATAADSRAVWQWNNAKDVRAVSVTDDAIPYSDHYRWYRDALADPSVVMWVIEWERRGVGVVRMGCQNAGRARISIAIEAVERGRKLGRAAIAAACRHYNVEYPDRAIEAVVAPNNEASMRSFAAAGFVHRRAEMNRGRRWLVLRRDPEPRSH